MHVNVALPHTCEVQGMVLNRRAPPSMSGLHRYRIAAKLAVITPARRCRLLPRAMCARLLHLVQLHHPGHCGRNVGHVTWCVDTSLNEMYLQA